MSLNSPKTTGPLRSIPIGVWALGAVSLFMDFSSEMIHALLPVYLATTLGASMTTVGIIEGAAEATAQIVKIFSGALSDWLGRRKWLAVAGYGMAALTKPIFPLAPDVFWISAARFLDRVGKGIRGAPRDALVADITPPQIRGAAFGLRQTLDTIGAFLGPAVAALAMWLTHDDFRAVFWIAVIPAILAVTILIFAVREPEGRAPRAVRFPLHIDEIRRLDARFWAIVALGVVFSLARFSEAFLILKAQAVGLPAMLAPLVLVAMNIVYAGASYPAGVLADRGGRRALLGAGLVALIAAELALALASDQALVWTGVALWGLHMGLTQGLFAALVAQAAPASLRGSAFGVFNLTGGIAQLAASGVAGALWDRSGPTATFAAGAA
ncbi:MAG: MFS transporter, partial [Methylocystis sp.]|nr:MFS transporter [Methylocystis sp.]